MASVAGSSISIAARSRSAPLKSQAFNELPGFGSLSLSTQKSFPSVRLRLSTPRLRVSCSAKTETLEKVCGIVRKQLALPADSSVEGGTKFSQLGADSLDTVEVVMALEEEFEISVEEESAQSIVTVEDAANLIDKLVAKKSA
ncbi:unnamed protein product [Spirodela intermedia]|uniref:Acyl carrier protein n=1 Tax=Spirodela intermedia TaxID=51605 RepID=A0A7I8I9X7_SPIIN|nr:unnamed protein product [Spirodela intermedia]CAA6654213.1 unnamed protein product [Spirodela intermedia]